MSALDASPYNDHEEYVAWIAIATQSISLLIVSVICILSKTRMKSSTNQWLKIGFFCAVGCAILLQLSLVVLNVAWFISANNIYLYSALMSWLFIGELFSCLVVTFVVRLWLIFKNSVWRLSAAARNSFITLCVLLQFSIVCVIVQSQPSSCSMR